MEYRVLMNKQSGDEYIYISLDRSDTSMKNCRKLIIDINNECRRHGYERVMIDLSRLTASVSVSTVYRAATIPISIDLLPFRLAWVNNDKDWRASWRSLELVMRSRSLPWRSFSDHSSAELWLSRDRQDACLYIKAALQAELTR